MPEKRDLASTLQPFFPLCSVQSCKVSCKVFCDREGRPMAACAVAHRALHRAHELRARAVCNPYLQYELLPSPRRGTGCCDRGFKTEVRYIALPTIEGTVFCYWRVRRETRAIDFRKIR